MRIGYMLGRPIYLTTLADDIEFVYLSKHNLPPVDVVFFDGGCDVSPSYYNELNTHSACNEERDANEYYIFKHYTKLNTKMCGICRGSQFLNVACGGTLYQDLGNLRHSYNHSIVLKNSPDTSYKVGDCLVVNSTHHQAVKDLGKSLVLVAREPATQIIEAYMSVDTKLRAVQFHPEFLDFPSAEFWLKWLFFLDNDY